LLTAVKRAYQLGHLVGLPRLYGTAILNINHLKRMSRDYYDTILIPAIRNHQWPPCDIETTEDLVFSDGAPVTPGSQAEEAEASDTP
jgi:hypothetical protein